MVIRNNLTHFNSLILMGIKIQDQKKTPLRIRSFLSLVLHFKEFEP
jgi:hypothetical protein